MRAAPGSAGTATALGAEQQQQRPGGQRGHRGTTLRQSASPQRTVSHLPASCAQCGAALSAADMVGEPQRRQVFELPPPPPLEVSEHQAQACRCGQCGRVTRAVFPAGVNAPAQYGERLAATAVYLQNTQLLPEQRLAEVFADLFGVQLCSASLAGMTRKAAQRWHGADPRSAGAGRRREALGRDGPARAAGA